MENLRKDLQETVGRKTPGSVDCRFCRFLTHEVELPHDYLEEDFVASFTPLHPVIPGHRLFIARTHIQDAAESPLWAGIVIQAAARYASVRRNDFNLITCAGSWATQKVLHLYVHYVPRNPTDKLRLPWLDSLPAS